MFSKFIVQPTDEYSTLLNKIKLNNQKFNVITVPEIESQKLLLVNLATDALSRGKKVMFINPDSKTDFETLFLSKLTQDTIRNLKNSNFIKKASSQEKILKAQKDSKDLTLIQRSMELDDIKGLCENINVDYLFIYRIELIPNFTMLSDSSFNFIKPGLVVIGSITEINDKLPLGIEKLDYDLQGGFDRGSLFTIGGKLGSGKTESCIALGCNTLRSKNREGHSKLKVVHVSVVESAILTMEKYYRNIKELDPKYKLSPNDLVKGFADNDEVFSRIKFISCKNLERIITELNDLYEEFKYDLVIIDDLDQVTVSQFSKIEEHKSFNGGIGLLHEIANSFNCVIGLSMLLRDKMGGVTPISTSPHYRSNVILEVQNDQGIKTFYTLKNRYAMNNVTYEIPSSFYNASVSLKDQNKFIKKLTKKNSHVITLSSSKDQVVSLKFQDDEFNYSLNCQLNKDPVNFKFIDSE